MGARSAGLGYASATLHDEWSIFNNVGGLSKVDQPITSFAYEARPGLIGANRMAAALSSPLKTGVAGFGLFRFGDDLYSEQVISGGYSNQFGIASLGLAVNYIQYRADGFGIKNAVSLNFGGVAQITPQISAGAYILHLNQPRLSRFDEERLPTKLVAGLGFKPSEKFLLAVELEKDLAYDPVVKGCMEYLADKKVYFRTGFNLHPIAAFFGWGFLIKRMKIDYAFQYNSLLGATHHASVGYHLEKKKKQHAP